MPPADHPPWPEFIIAGPTSPRIRKKSGFPKRVPQIQLRKKLFLHGKIVLTTMFRKVIVPPMRSPLDRAMSAYYSSRNPRFDNWGSLDQPCLQSSGVEELDGKTYVVLRNARGILALYRVRPHGPLRRLVRPPRAVTIALNEPVQAPPGNSQ
jgi:hypothetical protein